MKKNITALQITLLFVFITVVWTAYRYFFILPEWIDEFIAKPLIDLLPILFVVLTVEKNSLDSLGLTRNKYWIYVFMGFGLGVLLLGESVIVRYFRFGTVQVFTLTPLIIFLNLLIASATAFVEETVFRGYFFRRIIWIWKNEVVANILSSTFFTIVHVPMAMFVLHYNGADLIGYSLQIYVLGTIFAFVFARVKSIVPTTIAHALWNFSNIFIK